MYTGMVPVQQQQQYPGMVQMQPQQQQQLQMQPQQQQQQPQQMYPQQQQQMQQQQQLYQQQQVQQMQAQQYAMPTNAAAYGAMNYGQQQGAYVAGVQSTQQLAPQQMNTQHMYGVVKK